MTEKQECEVRARVWKEVIADAEYLNKGKFSIEDFKFGAIRFNQLTERENENG